MSPVDPDREPTMKTNLELVHALYAAFRSKDYETFGKLCDPDLEWIQNEGFPYGGRHRGPAAVVEGVFKTLPRYWDDFGFDAEEFHAAVNSVFVVGFYRGRHRETKKSFRAATIHAFDIAQGRIRRFRQFTDTALVRDAAGMGPVRAGGGPS
jgi:ketosteroid isomerase-like protein